MHDTVNCYEIYLALRDFGIHGSGSGEWLLGDLSEGRGDPHQRCIYIIVIPGRNVVWVKSNMSGLLVTECTALGSNLNWWDSRFIIYK